MGENKKPKPKPLPDSLGQVILEGKICSIVGYGNVGKRIARICAYGLGMQVKAFTRSATLPPTQVGCHISSTNNEISLPPLPNPLSIPNEDKSEDVQMLQHKGKNSEDFEEEDSA